MMLTHCEESGLGPIHICMGTTVPMNTSSSGVWLGHLVGRGFKPRRGRIQGVQTIVLTLVDLTPMWLSSSDTRGINLQQEPSLETTVYNKWPEPVLPGEWGKPPLTPKNLSSFPRMGKTSSCKPIMYPFRRRKVQLLGQHKKLENFQQQQNRTDPAEKEPVPAEKDWIYQFSNLQHTKK